MGEVILTMKDIDKSFPGVHALDHVNFEVKRGEVHALMGENGAGKSTLMKVLTGIYQKDSGSITYKGQETEFHNTKEAQDAGVVIVHQELNMVGDLTVAQNIFIGREPKKGFSIDDKKMIEDSKKLFQELNIEIDPREKMNNLTVGKQQMCEIAKAISHKAEVIIFDEPSAALTEKEIADLFEIIRDLRKKGLGIVYISHRMEEIFTICDRVSVFRDGQYIQTMNVRDTNVDELIRIMVNRELGEQYPCKNYKKGKKVLEIKNFNTSILKNVSLEAYEGEILGLAGLVGAGRTETARALFGADKLISGEIYLRGKKIKISSPRDAIKNGIGLIPEDRKKQGVLLGLSIRHNISFANLGKIKKNNIISMSEDIKASKKYIEALEIKTPSEEQLAGLLSGGNQQKVVLAKWLFRNSDILIFDEPTRGIDVGAKQEIYKLMVDLVTQGKVIIMISSDMPELIGMSDRIIVMHKGEIKGSLTREEFSQETILSLASGIK